MFILSVLTCQEEHVARWYHASRRLGPSPQVELIEGEEGWRLWPVLEM